MSEQPEVLVLGGDDSSSTFVLDELKERCRLVEVSSLADFIERINSEQPPDYYLLKSPVEGLMQINDSLSLLSQIPDAILQIDQNERVMWANRSAEKLLNLKLDGDTPKLFDLWEGAQIVGPDFSPVNSVLSNGKQAKTTVKIDDKTYFEFLASPLPGSSPDGSKLLLAILRDTSDEVLQQQKLDAVHQAGTDLGDLEREELLELTEYERIELLKSKLIHYTQELLEFDTVEVRVIDQNTQELTPLINFGMDPTAAARELRAQPHGNGVTGFVAATGRSYLCEDTSNDPLYIEGVVGAKSSLTVPLVRRDLVLGTFNVESPNVGAFSTNDLKFVELFCREVATALNYLDLLSVEQMHSVEKNTQKVLCEVAAPVDDILNDTSWIYERFRGEDSELCHRIKHILKRTQDIRDLIRQTGKPTGPNFAGAFLKSRSHPLLADKRVLVVDTDPEIRKSAHIILEQNEMTVDAVRSADEALRMVRTFTYHAVIADKRPPDMKGSDLFRSIREIHEHLPIMLMTGFDYDGEHTLIKCREMGMKETIYKPFIIDKFLKAIENAVKTHLPESV
ncbi:hybrid sensor histidine kinase/response regulator [Thalassoglobus polymorphus]|uniref:C4-dicarboxylate transport transcriptional regulatory protein DctD n=1 Tax=Thalassoglobus polymorphus TaxID=2527994 RepID=A0A517QNS0_9PLAN|nr:response regulator [Thalassoglobus polymorphus]QDT33279.1 C4-dicarboxylate transport transcriptional regulatory protein DctD [Thalassoglobus polymorphus]